MFYLLHIHFRLFCQKNLYLHSLRALQQGFMLLITLSNKRIPSNPFYPLPLSPPCSGLPFLPPSCLSPLPPFASITAQVQHSCYQKLERLGPPPPQVFQVFGKIKDFWGLLSSQHGNCYYFLSTVSLLPSGALGLWFRLSGTRWKGSCVESWEKGFLGTFMKEKYLQLFKKEGIPRHREASFVLIYKWLCLTNALVILLIT